MTRLTIAIAAAAVLAAPAFAQETPAPVTETPVPPILMPGDPASGHGCGGSHAPVGV